MNTPLIISNLHIHPGNFINSSRMLREGRSLIKQRLVDRVIWAGMWQRGLAKVEQIDQHIVLHRLDCILPKSSTFKFLNIFPFLIFYFKVVLFCKRHRVHVVNCHTLTVLPLGVLLKLLYGVKLIYDPHELETETNDSRGIRKIMAKGVERFFIKFSDCTIVVSKSILDWYVQKYKLKKINLIRNIPSVSDFTGPIKLRDKLDIKDGDILFLYLGLLEKGRGIEIMLNAFQKIVNQKHILFMGSGSLTKLIQDQILHHHNIHYMMPVDSTKVIESASGADVGISLIENSCLSYYYCLPNKVFEYIFAGIPFIGSDFPEFRREFASFDSIWLIEPTEKNLLEMIEKIDYDVIRQKKENLISRQGHWKWELEERKYVHIYKSLYLRSTA